MQELFDKQSIEYKKVLDENSIIFAEAGGVNSWHKYTGKDGLTIGLDVFGESALRKSYLSIFLAGKK